MKFSLKKVLTAATALVASVGMAVSGVAVANAAEGDSSITINSSTSLADRTFDVYEPIQITDTAGEKDNRSYTLKVKDGWLPVINSAEVSAGLTGAATDNSEAQALRIVSDLSDAAKVRSFAEALLAAAKSASLSPVHGLNWTSAGSGSSYTKSTPLPENGWYLVDETTPDDPSRPSGEPEENSPVSLVMATPIAPNATIDIKSTTPTSHKNIVDDETGANKHKDDAFAMNQTHHYELDFKIPSQWATQYTKGFWFQMNDTFSKGLTVDHGSFKVKVDGADWDANTYYAAPVPKFDAQDPKTGDTTFTMLFGSNTEASAENQKNLQLAGKTVQVFYKAHLNDDAVVAGDGNPNESNVTYQHSPNKVSGGEKTPTEHTHVYTFDFNFTKVDAADHTKQLTGAQFQVLGTDNGTDYPLHFDRIDDNTFAYNPAGTVTDITTNGHKVQFKGLNAGTYKLHELKAPAGYRVLGSDITVTVVNKTATDAAKTATDSAKTATDSAWTHTDHAETDDNGYQPISYTVNSQEGATDAAVVAVPNSKGFLPQTGGTGIIVLVAAGLLLLAAGAVLLRRQRKGNAR